MSKRNLVIIGNWKMNKTPIEAKKFMTEFNSLYKKSELKLVKGIKFGFASPSIDLDILKAKKTKPAMIVASQTINQHESGAFTGELSTKMVKAAGANATLIGHSERREYYNESDKDVNDKLKTALKDKLLPVVCIGETLVQRKSKKWKTVLSSQIKKAFTGITKEMVTKVVIAYEPIWAIGTGVTASNQEAQEACKHVRSRIKAIFGSVIAEKIIIQYGGSVKPDNVAGLMGQSDIDGALVGGASLDAKSFIKLLTLNK